jgi:type IV pilus assembly protein PilX
MKLHNTAPNGFALITALMLLVGLTLLGISAMRTSIFDEKAAGNTAFRSAAHNLAESAIKVGIEKINAVYIDQAFPGASPPLDPPNRIARKETGAGDSLWKDESFWTDANSVVVNVPGVPVARLPRYSAELLKSERAEGLCTGGNTTRTCRDWYRVTARAVDSVTGAAVVLQATYGRQDVGI